MTLDFNWFITLVNIDVTKIFIQHETRKWWTVHQKVDFTPESHSSYVCDGSRRVNFIARLWQCRLHISFS